MAIGHVGTFFGRKDQDKHYKLLSKFFADVCPMLGMAPRREKESPKLGHGAGRGRHFWGSGFFVSKTWIEPNLTSQLVHRDIFWLVVGNLFFHSVGNFIIPTDELIFFRGLGIPPTSFRNPFRVFQNFND